MTKSKLAAHFLKDLNTEKLPCYDVQQKIFILHPREGLKSFGKSRNRSKAPVYQEQELLSGLAA